MSHHDNLALIRHLGDLPDGPLRAYCDTCVHPREKKRFLPVELTDATFDDQVTRLPTVVIFKASWCGHCQRYLVSDEYTGLLKQLPNGRVTLALYECGTSDAQRYKQEGVRGFPTLFLYMDGERIPIEDRDQLQIFLRKQKLLD